MSAGKRTSAGYNQDEPKRGRTMTVERSIQDVEADLARAQERAGELSIELQDVEAVLAAKGSADSLLDAALKGKSIARTAKVANLKDRRTEIKEMLSVLENHQTRLNLERLAIREAELAAELEAAGEVVMQKREAESQATAERVEAENMVARMRDETYTLQDSRRRLENQLYQHDAKFRQEQEAAAEKRRAEAEPTPEEVERHRQQINREVFGRIEYEDDEQFREMSEEAARQGSRLTPAYRGVSPVHPE